MTYAEFILHLLVFAAIVFVTMLAAGCNSISGGEASRHDDSLRVEVRRDGTVLVTDARSGVSTTQPSASGWNSLPAFGRAKEGELSAVSFEGAKESLRNVWPLVLMFLAGAVGLWFLGERLAAIVCAALAVVTMLYPIWTALGAAVLILYAAWSQRKRIKQIIIGNEVALEAVPESKKKEMKLLMKTQQDESTAAVVDSVTSTTEAKRAVEDIDRALPRGMASFGGGGKRGNGKRNGGGEPIVVTVDGGEPAPEVVVTPEAGV